MYFCMRVSLARHNCTHTKQQWITPVLRLGQYLNPGCAHPIVSLSPGFQHETIHHYCLLIYTALPTYTYSLFPHCHLHDLCMYCSSCPQLLVYKQTWSEPTITLVMHDSGINKCTSFKFDNLVSEWLCVRCSFSIVKE